MKTHPNEFNLLMGDGLTPRAITLAMEATQRGPEYGHALTAQIERQRRADLAPPTPEATP